MNNKLVRIFKTALGISYRDKIKYNLIHRYIDKVSNRLKKEIPVIEDRSIKRWDKTMEYQTKNSKPILGDLIGKSEWDGGALIVPFLKDKKVETDEE